MNFLEFYQEQIFQRERERERQNVQINQWRTRVYVLLGCFIKFRSSKPSPDSRNRLYFVTFFRGTALKSFLPRISWNRPISLARIISLREQLVSGTTGPTACPCFLSFSSTFLLNFICYQIVVKYKGTIPIPIAPSSHKNITLSAVAKVPSTPHILLLG